MRCLIVVPSLSRAGAETQAVDLANGLSVKGHSVYLCSYEANLDQQNRLSTEVHFRHLPKIGKLDFMLIRALAKVIDRESIQIVLGVLQVATLIAWLAAKWSARKPPVVAGIHTTLSRNAKHEFYDRVLYRRLLRRLAAIVFVCEHQRDHWLRKYPELQHLSSVVHNGVAPERFSPNEFALEARRLRMELGLSGETFIFACIAAFRPEKGHRLVLEALSRIQGEVCVVFAGEGDLRPNIEAIVSARGLEARTRFLGSIPDTRPLIAASNATLLASTAVETFSMAMLESMAMSVPVVAPRIGGLPEAVIHGETGLLFPIGDVSALLLCMQYLVDRPSEAASLGGSAGRKVRDEFTLAKMVAGSERVLDDVLGKLR